jgi:hypothetical protein
MPGKGEFESESKCKDRSKFNGIRRVGKVMLRGGAKVPGGKESRPLFGSNRVHTATRLHNDRGHNAISSSPTEDGFY